MGAPCVNIFEYPLGHRLNLTNFLLIPHSSFSSDEKKTYKLFTWGVWAWWAWWLISFTGWVTTWMPSSFFALHCKMVQKNNNNNETKYFQKLHVHIDHHFRKTAFSNFKTEQQNFNCTPITGSSVAGFLKRIWIQKKIEETQQWSDSYGKKKGQNIFNNTFVHNISVGKQFFPGQVDLLLNASYFLLPIFRGCSKHNKTLKLA